MPKYFVGIVLKLAVMDAEKTYPPTLTSYSLIISEFTDSLSIKDILRSQEWI